MATEKRQIRKLYENTIDLNNQIDNLQNLEPKKLTANFINSKQEIVFLEDYYSTIREPRLTAFTYDFVDITEKDLAFISPIASATTVFNRSLTSETATISGLLYYSWKQINNIYRLNLYYSVYAYDNAYFDTDIPLFLNLKLKIKNSNLYQTIQNSKI